MPLSCFRYGIFAGMEKPAPGLDSPLSARTPVEAALAALESHFMVALLINSQAALLIAANAAGRELFPALQSGQPLPLDAAMPAVRDLRGLVEAGESSSQAISLIFWTVKGPVSFVCRVEAAGEDKDAPLFLVVGCRDAGDAADPSDVIASQIRGVHEPQGAAAPPADPGNSPAEPALQVAAAAPEPQGLDLAKLAHELKTPISAIAAAAEIMKEGRFGDIGNARYAGYISDIHDSARHALVLIERMLNQRVGAGFSREPDLRIQRLDLVALVDSCLSALAPVAEARGLSLQAQHRDPQVVVSADATALRQIVLNLISNAIKFTSDGGAITIETVAKGEHGPEVSVYDTGAGMTATEIAEALKPEPLDIGDRRLGGGLGLGLPLSRTLAEAMGASLSIDSVKARGTRVILRFGAGPPAAI